MGRVRIYVLAVAAIVAAVVLAALRVGEQPGALSGWQALVLGITQGFTELLPISSSGHLILVPWLFDWHYLETHEAFNKTFDVALHAGTLVAVVVYFWEDVKALVAAWFRTLGKRRIETGNERIAWFVLLATIPAAIAGYAGESAIEEHLGQPWQIAVFLAAFGIVLWFADRRPQTATVDELGYGRSLLVGLAQCLALMPGVSRSGITITAGRLMCFDRDSAARFSFLLLVPVVFGASVLKGVKDIALGDLPPGWVGPFAVGVLAALGVGLLAIVALLGYVRRHDYTIFVVYRLGAALLILLLIASGARSSSF